MKRFYQNKSLDLKGEISIGRNFYKENECCVSEKRT
jgi:hypothetical protein